MSKPAATLGCHHTCPVPKHIGGPVIGGSQNVFYEGIAACRQNDPLACNASSDAIANGSTSVYINGLQAARLGDPSIHGGLIVEGVKTIFIG